MAGAPEPTAAAAAAAAVPLGGLRRLAMAPKPPSLMCEQLLWVDSLSWAGTALTCLLSSMMCWFTILHIQSLSHEEIVPFVSANRALMWVGVSVAILGIVLMFLAMTTRSIITARSERQAWVFAAMYGSCLLAFLAWWAISTQRLQGDRRCRGPLQFLRFQLGAFGFGRQVW